MKFWGNETDVANCTQTYSQAYEDISSVIFFLIKDKKVIIAKLNLIKTFYKNVQKPKMRQNMNGSSF